MPRSVMPFCFLFLFSYCIVDVVVIAAAIKCSCVHLIEFLSVMVNDLSEICFTAACISFKGLQCVIWLCIHLQSHLQNHFFFSWLLLCLLRPFCKPDSALFIFTFTSRLPDCTVPMRWVGYISPSPRKPAALHKRIEWAPSLPPNQI